MHILCSASEDHCRDELVHSIVGVEEHDHDGEDHLEDGSAAEKSLVLGRLGCEGDYGLAHIAHATATTGEKTHDYC